MHVTAPISEVKEYSVLNSPVTGATPTHASNVISFVRMRAGEGTLGETLLKLHDRTYCDGVPG